jgi:DNA helicase TIP49 (TBP-interacting protein)
MCHNNGKILAIFVKSARTKGAEAFFGGPALTGNTAIAIKL